MIFEDIEMLPWKREEIELVDERARETRRLRFGSL
jgi:hypothetical protein